MNNLPRLLTEAETADYLHTTIEALADMREHGTGPQWLEMSGSVMYAESDLAAYLDSIKCGCSPNGSKAVSPAALAAALKPSMQATRQASIDRMKELADFSKESLDEDRAALTMGTPGSTPGERIERHFNVPPQEFNNLPPVAVANAANGRVPIPRINEGR